MGPPTVLETRLYGIVPPAGPLRRKQPAPLAQAQKEEEEHGGKKQNGVDIEPEGQVISQDSGAHHRQKEEIVSEPKLGGTYCTRYQEQFSHRFSSAVLYT